MYYLMRTFINCLIYFLKDGGGISLGYDPSTRSIFVAFSSDKGILHTLNIDPRALKQDQYTQERVVKMLCDRLTHNPETKQERKSHRSDFSYLDQKDDDERMRMVKAWDDIKLNVKYDPTIHADIFKMLRETAP